MKTKSNILFKLFLLTCVGVAVWYLDIIPTVATTVKLLKTQQVQTAVKTEKLQSELDKYKEQERKKKAEEERLKNIQVTQIINSEIRKDISIRLVEGDQVYQMPFDKQAFVKWFNNTLYLEIPYTYNVMLSNTAIKAVKTENGIVTFEVAGNLDYTLSLKAKEIKNTVDKKLFGVDFSEEDLKVALGVAEDKVMEQLLINEEIHSAAMQSLEEYLQGLAQWKDCTAEIIYK